MNALIKVLIGVVLLVVPLGMYAYELMSGVEQGISLPVVGVVHLWKSLIILIMGTVPPFVMLIGLFIVWLELDEWRIEKELKKEEEKEEEKPKTTARKVGSKSRGRKKKGRPKRKKRK